MAQTVANPAQNTVITAETAVLQIEKSITKDNMAPTLVELMNVTPQTGPTASGLSDYDYPTLMSITQAADNMTQMRTLTKVPLPTDIVEHLNHMQCHCMMGLFTEINRAWLTIDSDIYLWMYDVGNDIAYFDGLNDTIISVGLVDPKPGVFHNFIKHLLILVTAVDVVILGVTFTNSGDSIVDEIQLVPEPVSTISTDGATVTAIAGTKSGRIFFGTKDGAIYEIVYQAESNWFGKRFKKINHSTHMLSFLVPSFVSSALTEEEGILQIVIDNSRHILYTLTDKSSIEVYDMGELGTSFSKIIRVTQKSILQQAVHIVKNLDNQHFCPIISISPIEFHESTQLNLVAITQGGIRLYLSTANLSNTIANQRPYSLILQHVRLPPGYSATMTVRPRNVHTAHYSDGKFVMVSNVNDKDLLWCISNDLFPFSSTFTEVHTSITLDGPVLAMSEIRVLPSIHKHQLQSSPPSVVTQHMQKPTKYVVLTAQGAHIFLKLRPVDLLKQLLVDGRGQDSDAIKSFFGIQEGEQACATSLILACLDDPQNVDIANYATMAFFLHGGEPRLVPSLGQSASPFLGTTSFMPDMVSTPVRPFPQQQHQLLPQNVSFPQHSHNLSQLPHDLQQTNISQMNIDVSEPFSFSSKHNGLYLYLERILRPIWNILCVDRTVVEGKKVFLISTITSNECSSILNHLNALRSFLQRNTLLSVGLKTVPVSKPNVNVTQNTSSRSNYTLHDVQIEEHNSLNAHKTFLDHCCQVIGLWKLLCEHQFHILMDTLQDEHKLMLENTTFKDLLVYGSELCSVLINNLINSYLGDNTSVDTISMKLREVCPDLYKSEDAVYSKIIEIFKTAKTIQSKDDKEDLILSATDLCKSIIPNINLYEVCDQLIQLKAYRTVITLCVLCAEKVDPGNVASRYTKKSDLGNENFSFYYTKRMEIYKQILFMLNHLHSSQDIENVTQSADELTFTSPKIENNLVVKNIINDILQHSDELLHMATYEWMISKHMTSDLIHLEFPTLEKYLLKVSQESSTNVTVLELLWKYYEKNNNHSSAARVLNSLATKADCLITLQDRLGYLVRAIMCMKNDKVGYAPYMGVFLRQLEDKLDIAKVQEQILDSIVNTMSSHPNADEKISALNSQLYDITQLYEQFAEPLNLWECKLAIINCASYSDEQLVEDIWRNILEVGVNRHPGTGNNKLVQVLAKVKGLVQLYKNSPNCFPLAFIIIKLEKLCARLGADVSLVPNLFVSVEIPSDVLITTYNKVMSASLADRFWTTEENEFHFSKAITELLKAFIENQATYNNVEKRKLIALGEDTVAGLLSNLYSKPNTEIMITSLKNIQIQLSRI